MLHENCDDCGCALTPETVSRDVTLCERCLDENERYAREHKVAVMAIRDEMRATLARLWQSDLGSEQGDMLTMLAEREVDLRDSMRNLAERIHMTEIVLRRPRDEPTVRIRTRIVDPAQPLQE